MLGGLGEFLELDPELLDDLKTAVSEACNNVVLHAYGDDTGPLMMGLEISEESFEVTVRDQGVGLQRVSSASNRMGVGLAVISALARRAEFQSAPGAGTEVRMSFGADNLSPSTGKLAAISGDGRGQPPVTGDIVVSLAPAALLGQVMGRLVRAVAAGAHFSVDRFPGLHRLTSEITHRATDYPGPGEVGFAIIGRPKRLELKVGPLPRGTAENLFDGAVPEGLAPMLQSIESSALPDAEVLEVVLIEPRR